LALPRESGHSWPIDEPILKAKANPNESLNRLKKSNIPKNKNCIKE